MLIDVKARMVDTEGLRGGDRAIAMLAETARRENHTLRRLREDVGFGSAAFAHVGMAYCILWQPDANVLARRPKRIQRKRVKGWKKPAGAVNVTRPSKWGNPFLPGDYIDIGDCLADYEVHIREHIRSGHLDLAELKGKDLMCWCRLDAPCHADVLLKMANEEP